MIENHINPLERENRKMCLCTMKEIINKLLVTNHLRINYSPILSSAWANLMSVANKIKLITVWQSIIADLNILVIIIFDYILIEYVKDLFFSFFSHFNLALSTKLWRKLFMAFELIHKTKFIFMCCQASLSYLVSPYFGFCYRILKVRVAGLS